MTHPDLTAALEPFDPGAVLRIALGARFAAQDGRYCECSSPELTGADLMCGECLLRNQDQEVRRVLAIVSAHDFVPGEGSAIRAHFCAVCTMPADAPRHNGVHAVGHTSWGAEVRP